MRKDFFISYDSVDRVWAEWVAWELEEAGYTTVLQGWDFRPGSNFVMSMQKASAEADRTIAILSPGYLASHFSQPEWAAAFAQDPTGEKGILLPVRVRPCDPQGMLPQIVYIDLVDRTEIQAKEVLLAGVLRERSKPTTRPRFPDITSRSVPTRPPFFGTPTIDAARNTASGNQSAEMGNAEDNTRKREDCWNKALEAFGTAFIFEQRAHSLQWKLHLLTFLGIGMPVAVGGMILSVGSGNKYLPHIIFIVGILGIIQLICSVWSLVARWEDSLSYSLESISANYRLSNDYKELAGNPPSDITEFNVRFLLLESEDENRSASDIRRGITETEKRKGMRAALREFQRPCIACGKVPTSLKPTTCNVCGDF